MLEVLVIFVRHESRFRCGTFYDRFIWSNFFCGLLSSASGITVNLLADRALVVIDHRLTTAPF